MIEAYVRSLDEAIGDRLPAEVKAQRLREAEGHLRMAAAELNQLEAVRRYGPARGVANAMVRVHRGYETASIWRLSVPLVAAILSWSLMQPPLYKFLPLLGDEKRALMGPIDSLFSLLSLILFVSRIVQTRRWLFWPVVLFEFTIVVLCNIRTGRSGFHSNLGVQFLWTSAVSCLIFFMINALVLGATRLADRRKVGRA